MDNHRNRRMANPHDRTPTGQIVGAYAPQVYAQSKPDPVKAQGQIILEKKLSKIHDNEAKKRNLWLHRIANPNPSTSNALATPK